MGSIIAFNFFMKNSTFMKYLVNTIKCLDLNNFLIGLVSYKLNDYLAQIWQIVKLDEIIDILNMKIR